MIQIYKDYVALNKEQDVIFLKNKIGEACKKIQLSLVNQTKIITAASELARNVLRYAGQGSAIIEIVTRGYLTGIRLTFEDKGPGIEDIPRAMQDGFSTGKSLGLGLPGAKRLVDLFEIKSEVGVGTTVTVVKWKNG